MGQNEQKTTQEQKQQTVSNPWEPTQGALQDIIRQIGQGGQPLSPEQSAALATYQSGAGGVPSYGALSDQIIKNLSSSTTTPQVGMINDAYKQFAGSISPIMNQSRDPMSDPQFASMIDQMKKDITTQTNSQFAAAGRDPNSNAAASQALGRGFAAGVAPVLANEYNTRTGQITNAAGQLMAGAGGAAGQTAQLGQIPLQNQLQSMGLAQQSPGLWMAPGAAQLQAANMAGSLPYQNTQIPMSMLAQLASLGGQTSGQMGGTSQIVQPLNPWTTAAGIGLGAAGLYGLSDIRLKEGVKPIGLLFESGLPVYRFNYKGDPTLRVGLMAQDVEKFDPGAVAEVGGVKFVNYDRATAPSAMAA